MKDFSKPIVVSALEIAFPTNVRNLMPEFSELPEEFRKDQHQFCKLANKWFALGLRAEETPKPKEGIDGTNAIRHISAIMGSYEPKHEHKIAGVGYLMSLWFEPLE